MFTFEIKSSNENQLVHLSNIQVGNQHANIILD